jgi:hypothetical protein
VDGRSLKFYSIAYNGIYGGWNICGNFEVIVIKLGIQLGYAKVYSLLNE